MNKIEHIGIAVSDLKKAKSLFDLLFEREGYKSEIVESERVTTHFYQLGDSKIELLESTDSNSAIGKFIRKRGEGMHHIAFDVSDIREEIKRLKQAGFSWIDEEPKKGADNKLVAFLHPKCTGGVLVEICQEVS
jgi:methylmalonyl-CoA/ethylmalonyl-CoA epimerase